MPRSTGSGVCDAAVARVASCTPLCPPALTIFLPFAFPPRIAPPRAPHLHPIRSCSPPRRRSSKLERARRQRAIVCTTPEAVKSLYLKYIEALNSVEAAPAALRVPKTMVPAGMGEKLEAVASALRGAEQTADSLAGILSLWGAGERGIALLDEVDIVLHPLRSELNFPVGPWVPLDLSPQRWDFPIHLLDALFFARVGRVAVPGFRPSEPALRALNAITAALALGEREFALQSSPHLVLLRCAHMFLARLLLPWWSRRPLASSCCVSALPPLPQLHHVRLLPK